MSKKSENRLGMSYGYVLGDWARDLVIGRLLTLIEVMGLPEKQEESTKGLIRQIIYTTFDEGIYIGTGLHTKIWEAKNKAKETAMAKKEPMPVIDSI